MPLRPHSARDEHGKDRVWLAVVRRNQAHPEAIAQTNDNRKGRSKVNKDQWHDIRYNFTWGLLVEPYRKKIGAQ